MSKLRAVRTFFWIILRNAMRPFRDMLFKFRVLFLQRSTDSVSRAKGNSYTPISLSTLPVIFISLEKRVDRRNELLEEFRRVGLTSVEWFKGVEEQYGPLGCAISHFEVLERTQGMSSLLMICEDDIGFICEPKVLQSVINQFAKDELLDVLQLDARTHTSFHPYSPTFALSNNSHSTGCYVLKPRAAEVLQRYFGESVERLSAGRPLDRSAIDIVWQVAQQWRLLFAVPTERLVVHKSGFSDVSGGYTKLDT